MTNVGRGSGSESEAGRSVVNDWAHIMAPTLAFCGAEDSLVPPGASFREPMKFVADGIPNGNGLLYLIAGLGHVPHFEAPEKFYPPLLAFLEEGLAGVATAQ